MEDKTPTQEEETLNLEQWEAETPKTYTAEEVEAIKKEMQSNSEKWVQKVFSEKRLYETALEESGNVAVNPERLVELSEENPAVAKIILDKFYDGIEIDDYKAQIGYQEDFTDPKKIEAMIKKQAQELARQEKLESEKQGFIEKLEMTDEEKTAFEEQLSELMQLKSFKAEDITKVMEKAYRISVNEDGSQKKLKNAEVIAKSMATAKWGKSEAKGGQEKEWNPFVDFYKKYS